MGVPKVFISSTYFDLRQVRESLSNAISSMGFEPIRSETSSFPIDPTLDTIENCRRVVEREADVLVLIIGGRYGCVPEDAGKSVTNLEYLTAKAKGIPIYVFIDRSVLEALPIYRDNPEANFAGRVENPAVFDFINRIREEDLVWTFAFDYEHQISETLRAQFAQRLGDALRVMGAMRGPSGVWLRTLSPVAFRLAVEQPKAWEHLLFGQALIDAIDVHRELRLRYQYGLAFGPAPVSSPHDLVGFLGAASAESGQLARSATRLLNEVLPEALGAPGEPGDARLIAYTASELGEVYRQILLWAEKVRCAKSIEGGEALAESLARFADSFVLPIEEFGPRVIREIRRGLSEGTAENPVFLELTLVLGSPDADAFERELSRFGRQVLGLS